MRFRTQEIEDPELLPLLLQWTHNTIKGSGSSSFATDNFDSYFSSSTKLIQECPLRISKRVLSKKGEWDLRSSSFF